MYKIKLEKFEGPLDLLLQLIEQQKLNITEVSLSQVTDQFIVYLNQIPDLHPEELADFLVVAAKLLLIKSRTLLPSLEPEEEEYSLEKQLKIYREFYEASKKINKIILKRRWCYSRESSKFLSSEIVFNPPRDLKKEYLKNIFEKILKDLEPILRLPKEVIQKTISIQEKIRQIHDLIFEKSSVSFQRLLKDSKSKTEIIVTFLALLELIKQRTVVVVQDGMFSDITIQKIKILDL